MQPNEVIRITKDVVLTIVAVPYFLFQFFRGIKADWNSLAFQRSGTREKHEQAELAALSAKLSAYAERAGQQRRDLCFRVLQRAFAISPDDPITPVGMAVLQLLGKLVENEGLFVVPKIDTSKKRSTAEVWELTAELRRQIELYEQPAKTERIEEKLTHLLQCFHPERLPYDVTEATVSVPLYNFLPHPAVTVELAMGTILNDPRIATPFPTLWPQLERNYLRASGIDPTQDTEGIKQPIPPTSVRGVDADRLIKAYLGGTPFADFLFTPLPFGFPLQSRFEHTHIVGGSGHGKTQLLQHLILGDLEKLQEGKGSIVVIDSQGDLIYKILQLAEFSPSHPNSLADRILLIDPNEVGYPPALNLFDFGLERLQRYDKVDREKLRNGAIELYEYLFGALLGAELTQRQGVIFRYLARLIMTIPGATIHTLREFMKDPETTKPYLENLDATSRLFFKSEFFSPAFDNTRQQIATRLWGVIENSALERMFGSGKNKLDLFDALNRGSIILINTAKDLLKQEGCAIFGRFFIALLCQAAQERAAIAENRRRPTFIYIDEAADYFDEGMQNLLNQGRKYKVGLVLAHQHLDQFAQHLRSTVLTNTAIKLVGGVSNKDATAFAKEMGCTPEFLQGMRKGRTQTQFACYIKNYLPQPITLTIPFGEMEGRPKQSAEDLEAFIERNRRRVSSTDEPPPEPGSPDPSDVHKHKML